MFRRQYIEAEDEVALSRCGIVGPVRVGFRSYANESFIRNAEIGRYCSIGRRVSIGAARHRTDLISTHPSIAGDGEAPRTVIGHDVWIGDNAVVMSGVTIGTGSVIGAGAVVTKDVEPYAVMAGVPARKLRDRFDERRKAELLTAEWWRFDYPEFPDRIVPDSFKRRKL